MKCSALLLFYLLSLTVPCLSDKQRSMERMDRTRVKRGVLEVIAAGTSIISKVASFGIEIYQLVKNGGDADVKAHSELKQKLETTLKAVELNRKQQDEIKNLIRLSIYQSHIADDRKEILSCFDTFKSVLNDSDSLVARELMGTCINIDKYVSDIGRMLIGKPITFGQKPIFDIVIDSKGRCDHRDINATFAYLYDLHVKGCVSITLAESMKYGDKSVRFQNKCKTTLQQAEEYHKDLYRRCAQERCNLTALTMRETLMSHLTCAEAANSLSQVLPWFDFTILKLTAQGKSYQNGQGRLRSTRVRLDESSFFKIFWTVKEEYQTTPTRSQTNIAAYQIPSVNVVDHYSDGSLEVLVSYRASDGDSPVYKGWTLDTTGNDSYLLVSGEAENLPSSCEPQNAINGSGDMQRNVPLLVFMNAFSVFLLRNSP